MMDSREEKLGKLILETPSSVEEPTWTARRRISATVQDAYIWQGAIGTGTFSSVMKAYSKALKRTVAIKVVSKQKHSSDMIRNYVRREASIVRNLRHENVIHFYEIIETTLRYCIVMQYAENGSLLDLLKKESRLSEARSRGYFKQLLNALDYIHGQGVAHRDIKCENIVLDRNNTLKLIDFGFACLNLERIKLDGNLPSCLSTTFCGSHAYASPEILCTIPYHPYFSDIWATGCVLYTLVCGKLPFGNDNKSSEMVRQIDAGVKFCSSVSESFKSLILKIFVPAKDRIYIDKIREHPWLTQADVAPIRPAADDEDVSSSKRRKL